MPRLFLILGDQLHPDPHPLLVDFDPARDRLLMIEAARNRPTSGATRPAARCSWPPCASVPPPSVPPGWR
jgi:hypothetical protein